MAIWRFLENDAYPTTLLLENQQIGSRKAGRDKINLTALIEFQHPRIFVAVAAAAAALHMTTP